MTDHSNDKVGYDYSQGDDEGDATYALRIVDRCEQLERALAEAGEEIKYWAERARVAPSHVGERELQQAVLDLRLVLGTMPITHCNPHPDLQAWWDKKKDVLERTDHLAVPALNEPCKGCGKRPIDFAEGTVTHSATLSPLERYALTVLDAHREDIGDLDGAFLQDKAEACGLLYYVEVTEPCGDYCHCAEYDDFPQQCLRLKPEFESKMAAHRTTTDINFHCVAVPRCASKELCAGFVNCPSRPTDAADRGNK